MARTVMRPTIPLGILSFFVARALTHDDRLDMSSRADKKASTDAMLWLHICLQVAVWGVIFPVGMVLGPTQSRWHVPLQSAGFVLTAAGSFIGYAHGGRTFSLEMAMTVAIPIILQILSGIYLKHRYHESESKVFKLHRWVGMLYPILGWAQILFGIAMARGYCHGGDFNQCLGQSAVGSGLVAYSILMAIWLLASEDRVKQSHSSPDLWDSWALLLFGIVSVFAQHRESDYWAAEDVQQRTISAVSCAGGIMGLLLSRNGKRCAAPALVLIFIGWVVGKGDDVESAALGTRIYAIFGHTLVSAGLVRMVEIGFGTPRLTREYPDSTSESALGDTLIGDTLIEDLDSAGNPVPALMHLPPLLLLTAGLISISGRDEEMRVASGEGVDHITYILSMCTYILIIFSLAFLLYTYIIFIVHLYTVNVRRNSDDVDIELPRSMANKNKQWYMPLPTTDLEFGIEEEAHIVDEDND